MVPRPFVASLLIAMLLATFAGCVDDPAPAEADPTVEEGGAGDDDEGGKRTAYEIDAKVANETELEGAHMHDEWGEAQAMPLADMQVTTADCSDNPFTDAFLIGAGLFQDQEVQKGCASFALGDGKIVPEGTARLKVEIDASEALPEGGMQLSYGNEMKRFVELEETTESSFSWTIEMDAVEWDLPHSTETDWWFFLRPAGQLAILDGSIHVYVVAERLDDWEPILASAHVDHWSQTEQHDFIEAGVLRALDTNVTVKFPSFADRLSGSEAFEPTPLDDIIPPETTQVTLAVQWESVEGCPAGHGCWVVAFLSPSNGGGRGFFVDPVESGTDWAIYRYDVPEPMAADSTYAEESVYTVRAFVRACLNGEEQQTPLPFFNGCMGEAVASMAADTRFEVVAWKDGADLDAVKERLGLA